MFIFMFLDLIWSDALILIIIIYIWYIIFIFLLIFIKVFVFNLLFFTIIRRSGLKFTWNFILIILIYRRSWVLFLLNHFYTGRARGIQFCIILFVFVNLWKLQTYFTCSLTTTVFNYTTAYFEHFDKLVLW